MVNRFYRKQIQKFQPCAGTVIGAGGKIVGAIVGMGYVQVLGYSMPVYHGPRACSVLVFSPEISVSRYGSKIIYASYGFQEY